MSLVLGSASLNAFMCSFKTEGPARKVRKSLVLDPWGKDCLNVQLFQEQLNNAQVSSCSAFISGS